MVGSLRQEQLRSIPNLEEEIVKEIHILLEAPAGPAVVRRTANGALGHGGAAMCLVEVV